MKRLTEVVSAVLIVVAVAGFSSGGRDAHTGIFVVSPVEMEYIDHVVNQRGTWPAVMDTVPDDSLYYRGCGVHPIELMRGRGRHAEPKE